MCVSANSQDAHPGALPRQHCAVLQGNGMRERLGINTGKCACSRANSGHTGSIRKAWAASRSLGLSTDRTATTTSQRMLRSSCHRGHGRVANMLQQMQLAATRARCRWHCPRHAVAEARQCQLVRRKVGICAVDGWQAVSRRGRGVLGPSPNPPCRRASCDCRTARSG